MYRYDIIIIFNIQSRARFTTSVINNAINHFGVDRNEENQKIKINAATLLSVHKSRGGSVTIHVQNKQRDSSNTQLSLGGIFGKSSGSRAR